MNPTTKTGLQLDQIVPLGRNANEYSLMFDLASLETDASVLDCGGGPSGFNAEWAWKGRRVVSIDPLYALETAEIKMRIDQTFDNVMDQVAEKQAMYRWGMFRDVAHLKSTRAKSMELFLADFRHGKEEGRYVEAELPSLPFADGSYDVALCSHLLFLYSQHLDLEFHLDAIREMMRVAKQARIYPLTSLNGTLSPHLCHVIRQLRHEGFRTHLLNVPYEFQKGTNQCLIVSREKTIGTDEEDL